MNYDPAADPVHGSGWNSAARWGGWQWREPHYGEHFRTCSFCGCIHPEDLAAEQAGLGACVVCGRAGWEACFHGQEHAGIKAAVRAGKLNVSEDERDRVLAMADEHHYDPGGWYASWADRKYGWPHKFYVEGLRPRDPSLLHCVGSSNSKDHPGGGNWTRAGDLTQQQKEIIRKSGMASSGEMSGWYLLEPRATLHAKFYTIHLADPAISDEVKETIQRVSGLWFKFTPDGRVSWAAERSPSEW